MIADGPIPNTENMRQTKLQTTAGRRLHANEAFACLFYNEDLAAKIQSEFEAQRDLPNAVDSALAFRNSKLTKMYEDASDEIKVQVSEYIEKNYQEKQGIFIAEILDDDSPEIRAEKEREAQLKQGKFIAG